MAEPSSSPALSLPQELWRTIIRYATQSDFEALPGYTHPSISDASGVRVTCSKHDMPLAEVLYKDKNSFVPHTTKDALTNISSKRHLALACRYLNKVTSEFLYETLYVSNALQANKLADALGAHAEIPRGRWVRQLTVTGVNFAPASMSTELAKAVRRILQLTLNLQSFHISWDSLSAELRETEESIIRAIPGHALRRFEWRSSGCGFERHPNHAFIDLLSRSKRTLRILKIHGSLPLTDQVSARSTDWAQVDLPELTQLSVSRSFRDDLALISTWRISSQLTCLSLGSTWSYFDAREARSAFWDTNKPALRCLHLGDDTALRTPLAHLILARCPNLRTLEYAYLGNWDSWTWDGACHSSLERVVVRTAHPIIAFRSLFNLNSIMREELLEKLLRHIQPFYTASELKEDAGSTFCKLSKITIVEYSHRPKELRYDPQELVQWLNEELAGLSKPAQVEISAELTRYMH